jgi:uncharacterized protein with PIN domain
MSQIETMVCLKCRGLFVKENGTWVQVPTLNKNPYHTCLCDDCGKEF